MMVTLSIPIPNEATRTAIESALWMTAENADSLNDDLYFCSVAVARCDPARDSVLQRVEDQFADLDRLRSNLIMLRGTQIGESVALDIDDLRLKELIEFAAESVSCWDGFWEQPSGIRDAASAVHDAAHDAAHGLERGAMA